MPSFQTPSQDSQHNSNLNPRVGCSRNDSSYSHFWPSEVGNTCWPKSTTDPMVTATQFGGNLSTQKAVAMPFPE